MLFAPELVWVRELYGLLLFSLLIFFGWAQLVLTHLSSRSCHSILWPETHSKDILIILLCWRECIVFLNIWSSSSYWNGALEMNASTPPLPASIPFVTMRRNIWVYFCTGDLPPLIILNNWLADWLTGDWVCVWVWKEYMSPRAIDWRLVILYVEVIYWNNPDVNS